MTRREKRRRKNPENIDIIKYPHFFNSKQDYIQKIDALLDHVETKIRKAANRITKAKRVAVKDIRTMNRMKYYFQRLLRMRVILEEAGKKNWVAIVREAGALFKKTSRELSSVY